MSMQTQLTVTLSKQGKRYVAYAPALDIATSGKSETEAKKRFGKLAKLFFEELEEAGTTKDVLTELGWTRNNPASRKPAWQAPETKDEQVSVRIPVAG